MNLNFKSTSRETQENRRKAANIAADPSEGSDLHSAALQSFQAGNHDRAIAQLEKAIQIDPANPDYHNNLGVIYRSQGRLSEASSCYRTAIDLAPEFADALSNLGTIRRLEGRFSEAIELCKQAIHLEPRSVSALFNLGLAFQAAGLPAEAVSAFHQVVEHQPTHSIAWCNLGSALLNQDRYGPAATCFQRALKLEPKYAKALNSLSIIRRIQKKPARAIRLGEKALAFSPGDPDILAHLAVLYQQTCQWYQLSNLSADLDRQTRETLAAGSVPSEKPLFSAGYRSDPEMNHRIARAWSNQISATACYHQAPFEFSRRRHDLGRITIGYLSSDFRDHPVAHQIHGLMRCHCRSGFRIFSYSTGIDDGSRYRKQIERYSDKFLDIRNLEDREAARQIYSDGVDILVDLNGHTAGNRLGICALRPAPVQATFLGFPGTSGATFFDYIITDRVVTPEKDLRYYSEQPVFLPDSYMITDDAQSMSMQPLSRADVGLPGTGFVFCSFNSAFKFEPVLFKAWMSILDQVPGSCLWLPQAGDLVKEALLAEAGMNGIDTARIIFAPKLPSKADYLARLKLADMALDTRIYNGHVSTCDALWAGLPVLTVTGNHFASRVSTSMLKALDVGETITASIEDYVETAVHLATQPEELARIREKLARHRLTQPLFNTAQWVRHLEAAFHEMWRLWLDGAMPRPITIDAEN